jgi:hypothetical protein
MRPGTLVVCLSKLFDMRRDMGRKGSAAAGEQGVVRMLLPDPETAEITAVVRFDSCTARVNVRALREVTVHAG